MGIEAQDWIKFGKEMIKEFGRESITTITRTIGTSYSNTTLEVIEGPQQSWQVWTAPIDYVGTGFQAETQVRTQAKQLYIQGGLTDAGTIYKPLEGDLVNLGTVYPIVKVLNVYETESTECAYLVQLGV